MTPPKAKPAPEEPPAEPGASGSEGTSATVTGNAGAAGGGPSVVTSTDAKGETPDPAEAAKLPESPAVLCWEEEDGYHFAPNAALEAKVAEVGENFEGLGERGFDSPGAARRKLAFGLAAISDVFNSAPWRVVEKPEEL